MPVDSSPLIEEWHASAAAALRGLQEYYNVYLFWVTARQNLLDNPTSPAPIDVYSDDRTTNLRVKVNLASLPAATLEPVLTFFANQAYERYQREWQNLYTVSHGATMAFMQQPVPAASPPIS